MKSISIITHQIEPTAIKRSIAKNYGIRNAAVNCFNHPNYGVNSTTSVMGALLGDRKHILFTTNANANPDFTLKKELEEQINFLRESCKNDEVKGFLIGGLNFDEKDREAQASYYFYSKLADALDSFQIPFSMFCGRERSLSPEQVYVRSHRIKITGEDFKKIFDSEKMTEEQILDRAENYYSDVLHDSGYNLNIQKHF